MQLRANIDAGEPERLRWRAEAFECEVRLLTLTLTLTLALALTLTLTRCIEWLQAWLLVADDIMDESQTRRGQPCWYKCKGVGHIAINDAVTIEALVFKILKRHFAQDACYLQLVRRSK